MGKEKRSVAIYRGSISPICIQQPRIKGIACDRRNPFEPHLAGPPVTRVGIAIAVQCATWLRFPPRQALEDNIPEPLCASPADRCTTFTILSPFGIRDVHYKTSHTVYIARAMSSLLTFYKRDWKLLIKVL